MNFYFEAKCACLAAMLDSISGHEIDTLIYPFDHIQFALFSIKLRPVLYAYKLENLTHDNKIHNHHQEKDKNKSSME